MRVALLCSALLATACAPSRAAPWVPSLVVTTRVGRGGGEGREAEAWRVEGALRWRLGRPRAVDEPPAVVKPPASHVSPSPCVDAALCAWERRARARALRGVR